ncbi:MAG: hypothetical protein ABSB86_04015 [Bryobacteraceae bacterium]|jgi:hypothetical protein
MRRAVVAAIFFQATVVQVWAAEPLLGTWRLQRQEVNGEKTNSEPLTLRVSQSGDKLAFAFSVPVNNIDFVSMSYTVRLDGTEADVKNAQGEKIGIIKITPAGASQYVLTIKGANRPESSGKLTVSPDGKTLTSESESQQAGRSIHSKQSFSRD